MPKITIDIFRNSIKITLTYRKRKADFEVFFFNQNFKLISKLELNFIIKLESKFTDRAGATMQGYHLANNRRSGKNDKQGSGIGRKNRYVLR